MVDGELIPAVMSVQYRVFVLVSTYLELWNMHAEDGKLSSSWTHYAEGFCSDDARTVMSQFVNMT